MKKGSILILFALLNSIVFSQSLNDKWLEQIDKGKEEYAINNYADALHYFLKAAQLVPTDTTAYTYILDCTFKTQNAKQFFDSFEKLLLLNYESARAYYQAIQICTEVEKDYQKAVNYVENAKNKFAADKNILMADILIYFKYGDYDASLQKLLAYLNVYPNDKKAIDLEFKIYYEIKKDVNTAIKILEKAQNIFPNDQEYVKKEVNIYIETQQMAAAEAKFQKLIELNPFEAKHYYNLSLILYNKGEYQQSVELASQAIELDPGFLDAIFNVGTFFYHKALQYNNQLLKMSPYQYTYNGQGRDIELTAKSYFEAAKPYFERAIELNTNEIGAFENLNTINALLKNINENQVLTDPYFTDLENEEKHKVYPDYELVSSKFNYPESKINLDKGDVGELTVTIKNSGQNPIQGAEVRLMEPFVNPMLAFNKQVKIPTLNSGEETSVSIPIKYLMNSPNTIGLQKVDNSENLIRFFVSGSDEKYTDLQQIIISLGIPELTTENNNTALNQTMNANLTSNKKAVNFLLVIGINEYSQWPKLNAAVADAKKFKETLLDRYDVNKENVFELYDKDASRNNIINELIKIKRELNEKDNLIIYYAGQSNYNSATDEGAWVPVDANQNTQNEYLDNTTLVSFLNSLNTQHTLLIADACFSESLFISDKDMTYKPKNDKIKSRWGLTSGNVAFVNKNAQKKETLFTTYLVEALNENQHDYIAISELISFVKKKMQNNGSQTPLGRPLKIEGNQGGELLLYKH